jgi:predicted amidohydrolase YtcJ
VAVRDGKFIKIGTNNDMKAATGPDTKVVDLKGRMTMPSIVDSHIHALRGGLAHLNFCSFDSSLTIDQIKDKLKACASKKKKGEWIEGSRFSASLVDKARAANGSGTTSPTIS